MIDLGFLQGKTVAVVGLGVAGLATLRALAASGVDYLAWDDKPETRAAAEMEGFRTTDYGDWDWTAIDEFVLSPGIPHTYPQPHPAAVAAREAGLRIVCDVDLLGRARPDATFVGVTGTNGKSTTTALIAHVLESAGGDIEVGGNLGPPVLAMRARGSDGVYVLELSSYQLERTFAIAFDVALLLNISADHLDRHGGLDGYIAAKRRIFSDQTEADTAIVGIDDEHSRAVLTELNESGAQKRVMVTSGPPVSGAVGVADGRLVDMTEAPPAEVADLTELRTLPGRHNQQNAAAAYAACRALGIRAETIAQAFCSFPGLPHRQEIVARAGDVVFVNDSKATNQDAAARALASYGRIYWIAGGQAKQGGYGELLPYLDRVVHAFLIGEAAPEIAAFLDGAVPNIGYSRCGALDRAARAAFERAANDNEPGEKIVLLSPACASFDQFDNFAARGDAFRRLAVELAGGDRAAAGGAS